MHTKKINSKSLINNAWVRDKFNNVRQKNEMLLDVLLHELKCNLFCTKILLEKVGEPRTYICNKYFGFFFFINLFGVQNVHTKLRVFSVCVYIFDMFEMSVRASLTSVSGK